MANATESLKEITAQLVTESVDNDSEIGFADLEVMLDVVRVPLIGMLESKNPSAHESAVDFLERNAHLLEAPGIWNPFLRLLAYGKTPRSKWDRCSVHVADLRYTILKLLKTTFWRHLTRSDVENYIMPNLPWNSDSWDVLREINRPDWIPIDFVRLYIDKTQKIDDDVFYGYISRLLATLTVEHARDALQYITTVHYNDGLHPTDMARLFNEILLALTTDDTFEPVLYEYRNFESAVNAQMRVTDPVKGKIDEVLHRVWHPPAVPTVAYASFQSALNKTYALS